LSFNKARLARVSGNVNTGVRLVNADGGYAISANSKEIVAIFNRTNTGGAIVEYKYNGSVVGEVVTNGTDLELKSSASTLMYSGGTQRVRIDTNGQTLFRTNGSQTTPINDVNLPIQIAETTAAMCYFGANKGNSYGSLFGHHTAYGGTVIRNVLSGSDIAFYLNSTQEKVRIKSSGEFHISDRNSGNSGEHFFQAGAFGIRMQDTGGFNWWRLEGNYGGYTQFINLRADRRIGVYATNPQSRVDFGYDANQSGNAFLTFKGPHNKSGEMRHKYVHNGSGASSNTVNLLEVTSFQSPNSHIYGRVTVMGVSPVADYGFKVEGYFYMERGSSNTTGTNGQTGTMELQGGSSQQRGTGSSAQGSLSWSGLTLRYETAPVAYGNMHIHVEYHAYDGATVVFDPDSRSF